MPWYLYLALKQLFPTGRFVSFFSLMAMTGVAIGVCVLYVAMSVMNGFQHEIRENLKATGGDIRVHGGGLIHNWEERVKTVAEQPGVDAVNPAVDGVVMAVHENRPAFPVITGIDVLAEEQVIPFEEKGYLLIGTLDDLYDESVFVSSGLAAKLGISVGESIDVYTPLIAKKLKQDELILPRELTVTGIYETGWGEVDKNTLVVTLRTMQDFYGMGEDVQSLIVRIAQGADVDDVAFAIERALGEDFTAVTWLEQNDSFLMVLALEKAMIFIITVFIVLVASFSIASMLLTAVVSKTREIGLLGALGAKPMGIAAVFAAQALLISLFGMLLGLGFAYLILDNINAIVHQAFQWFGYEDALWQFYEFNDFPVHYSANDLWVIVGATLILSLLAALIPALRASSMKPSEAMRYE